jgi:oxygen-independent coproporphyrinogen-3 oxidase
MDARELRRLGRRHEPADVAATVAAARSGGIGSIGVDLLYDVPGDSTAAWERTLEEALALAPDHLSLYALTLEDPGGIDHLPVTTGARRWRAEAAAVQDENQAVDAYRHATERLAAAGYRGYEISNWAHPGHESRHNLVYWERRPYEALGPGAHAFDGRTRRWTAANLDSYLAALAARTLPPAGHEVVDRTAAAAEEVLLALRLDRGVAAAAATRPPLDRVAPWAFEHELLARTPDRRLVLTTRGRLLSNELFARLL